MEHFWESLYDFLMLLLKTVVILFILQVGFSSFDMPFRVPYIYDAYVLARDFASTYLWGSHWKRIF